MLHFGHWLIANFVICCLVPGRKEYSGFIRAAFTEKQLPAAGNEVDESRVCGLEN